MAKTKFPFRTPFGHFSEDGTSFFVTRPDTPRPWVNVMSTGTYGVALSQTGSGYSWLHHAGLNRLTRWDQDLVRDTWGRPIYVRDEKSGRFWSVGWEPVRSRPQSYEVMHGTGYSIINSQNEGIQTQWLVFVPHEEPLEVWRLRIKNTGSTARSLSLWTYMEWNLGEAPDWHREFHRLFIETSFHDGNKIILARKRLSSLKNAAGQLWNRTWDHVAWHAVNLPVRAACGDKQSFLGNYGSFQSPEALRAGRYLGRTTHKWDDAVASLCVPVTLKPGEERSVLFTVGAADSQTQALVKARKFMDFSQVDNAWGRTELFWDKYLSALKVKTPDPGFDLLTNTWLPYQALSGRLWGRTAYYQTGGAYGFRDQLQDSLVLLSLDPEGTRRQILLHAAHQFPDGTVQHWWHPLSEEGLPSRHSDDLLWLPYALTAYLKETARWVALAETAPYLRVGNGAAPEAGDLYDHGVRAIDRVLSRMSPRGLPLIGEGDWNDGLSGAGRDGKGESVWLGMFLHQVLLDWAEMTVRAVAAGARPAREKARAESYRRRAAAVKAAVNRHGWDGGWYLAATTDDGAPVGSQKCKEGRIHLNPQTWAILSGVADTEARRRAVLRALERLLYGPDGPLLLTPAYSTPDERIGYLTRYAPGTRENGGVYLHAAVWALAMECRLGRAGKAWEIYEKISPVLRATSSPERYRAEPYVTPGNMDGPASPTPGRAGWTWYTGSAAWLQRVSVEGLLGVAADWDGLRVRPCLPPHWKEAKLTRTFRGGTYRISIRRDLSLPPGRQAVFADGQALTGDLVAPAPDRVVEVLARVGPAA